MDADHATANSNSISQGKGNFESESNRSSAVKSDDKLVVDNGISGDFITSEPLVDERIPIVGEYIMNSEKYMREVIKKFDSEAACIPKPNEKFRSVPTALNLPKYVFGQSGVANHVQSMSGNIFTRVETANNAHLMTGGENDVGHGGNVTKRDKSVGFSLNQVQASPKFVLVEVNFVKSVSDVVMKEGLENHVDSLNANSVKQSGNVWANKGVTLADKIKGQIHGNNMTWRPKPIKVDQKKVNPSIGVVQNREGCVTKEVGQSSGTKEKDVDGNQISEPRKDGARDLNKSQRSTSSIQEQNVGKNKNVSSQEQSVHASVARGNDENMGIWKRDLLVWV
ncbi:hypothetical protein L6452_32494 [Arctium lappa]|uniref:Uncharacterized protein n=1 Tax=Arctium lappa TaxID=4217 RepID=A0ACB8Z5M7_ARCLA|nr:hypothetical protein L6452_32494 [Arctium lappa]